MLIELTIENFRSIKDSVTFSMIATKDNSLDENLIKNKLKDNLLKSAVIYGPNASGKSNVILALTFLKMLVLNSHNHQKGEGIRFMPFKLDKKNLTKPTKMSIFFIKNQIKYNYNISFIKEKVIEESLYYYPKNKRAAIFKRNEKTYEFSKDEKEQKTISERTLPEVLYLSKSTQENYKKTADAFDWFKDLHAIADTEHPALEQFTIELIKKDEEIKKDILKALLQADVGIDDFNLISKKISSEELILNKMPPEMVKMVMKDKKEIEGFQLTTIHQNIPFDFQEEESEGTKKIFALMGLWIDSLKNGKVIIVDEMDTKLHYFLSLFLIKLFHDKTQNKSNAQLIFTTHNINLLDQDLFRRDQIWFTEKNSKKGNTELYSLTEYSPRKDEDIQKKYITGKYNAIPFMKENRIF